MKVLLYGINFYPELTGIGKYTGEMAVWLAENGHEVRVITAPPYYPEWQVHTGFSAFKYSTSDFKKVKVTRCPLYVPKSLSTLKRLLHLGSFAVSSFFSLLSNISWKPTVIICIEPTLLCVPGAKLLSSITRSKLLLHIQDYEIDAMLGLGMTTKLPLSNLARLFEQVCLKQVDLVSTISHSMMTRAYAKGISKNKVIQFPNWSEVDRFATVNDSAADNFRNTLGIPNKKKIILYSGNLGEKQGLDIIIPVANALRNKNYIFLIVGDGGGKAKLERLVDEHCLDNVIFRPLQNYDVLPALLKVASCHLVIQRKGVADAVLPSKLTNILAVGGNAVITAEENTELGRLCASYPGIATLVEPESEVALVDGIERALSLPSDNQIAKNYAKNFLEKDSVLNDFVRNLECHL